jgi:hypothetical protein
MYLFTRTARFVGGNLGEELAWAVGMTERVNADTDLEVRLWAHAYSPALGTVSWSTFVDDLGSLEAANDKLLGDAGYVAAANQGAALTEGGIDDALYQVIHGEVSPDRDLKYVSSVQSACANGMLGRGVEVGVEIAQLAESITGVPSLFVMNVTGVYGGVGWLSGFESIDELAAAQQALASDPKFVDLIDTNAAKAYTDDASASTQVVWRRVS